MTTCYKFKIGDHVKISRTTDSSIECIKEGIITKLHNYNYYPIPEDRTQWEIKPWAKVTYLDGTTDMVGDLYHATPRVTLAVARCGECGKLTDEPFVSAYRTAYCEECWDDYILTDTGKLEFLIGIADKLYSQQMFDADFLGEAVVSWRKFKDLTCLTSKDKIRIEQELAKYNILEYPNILNYLFRRSL